ncbi:hypothetical protein J4G07_08850 [Candidatus Poribacteria bacterium]|nr:hypothetical protein [Candidatus Poribacteria bacterium]
MSKQQMSADQLSVCRKQLEQRWKSRIMDDRRELVYEKTVEHAKSIDELFTTVSQELNTFTDSLAKPEEDE